VPGENWISALPYLPLDEPLRWAGWWLGSLEEFPGPWRDDDLENEARRFLGGFRAVDGKAIARPSVLVREAVGVDGERPTDEEIECLRLAIEFATVDGNPIWTSENMNHGWAIATADNADLWVQPLDLAHGYIALGRGGRNQTTVGGVNTRSGNFAIPAPIELHLPPRARLDGPTLEALYTVLINHTGLWSERLRVAIPWLTKSWLNTTSITFADRVVLLKTATEALTGTSNNTKAARSLRRLFATTLKQEGEGIGVDALLWSPDEPSFTRTWGDPEQQQELIAFDHWYRSFSDARNAILHEGRVGQLEYSQPSSPYAGPYSEVADRVVREAAKVALGASGWPEVWRNGLGRASYQALKHLEGSAGLDASA
jgi:hypothetical protein